MSVHGHRWWADPLGRVHFEHDCVDGRAEQTLNRTWLAESSGPTLGMLTITPAIECGRCGVRGLVVDGEWVPA